MFISESNPVDPANPGTASATLFTTRTRRFISTWCDVGSTLSFRARHTKGEILIKFGNAVQLADRFQPCALHRLAVPLAQSISISHRPSTDSCDETDH